MFWSVSHVKSKLCCSHIKENFRSRRTNDYHSVDFTTLCIVGIFWSRSKQRVEIVSNFIRKQNNFTDTDKTFGYFVGIIFV